MKPPIDRVGFINGNNWNGSLYDCRVVRGHSLECFDISVHSPGREEIQKRSVNVMGNRTDSHTKSPDIAMETHLEFHSMYECTRSVEPLVATTNKKYHNHGFIRGLHGLVHATLHAGADRTVDITPCGINHITSDKGLVNFIQETKPTFRGNHPKKNIPRLVMRFPLVTQKATEYIHQKSFQQELLTLKLIIVIQLLVPRPGDIMYNLSTEWDS